MSSLFLRVVFLRILDGGTVALGMSPCAPEFAEVARFVEGPAILDHPLNATRRNADTISYCSEWKI